MHLTVSGNIKRYYVQTLLMLFFPGEKYGLDDASENSADVTVSESGGIYTASAVIRGGTRESRAVASRATTDAADADRAAKIAVGEAVFRAAGEICGVTPPWGILTGVRPGKLARQLIESGLDEDAARERLTRDYLVAPDRAALVTEVARAERRIITDTPRDTCSVYISVPFCPTRCAYCSFVSYATPRLLSMIPEYLDRLCLDIERLGEDMRARGLRPYTVYIGGGTPTTLDARQTDRLLCSIDKSIGVATLREFTLEAGRPDTITDEKLRAARDGGVTRVSINPQTLCDEVLRGIGRRHTAADFYSAFNKARRSGIQYINTDLICGLPGESAESFRASVDGVLALRPDNLTVHAFTVKKASDVASEGHDAFIRPSEEASRGVVYAREAAGKAGYSPYYLYRQKNTVGNLENVGYTLPGAEGIYNVIIMEETQTILAAGAGAVTKIVNENGQIERIFAPKYPYEYLKND